MGADFDTTDPVTYMGVILNPGFGNDAFYGIGIDSDDNIWAGGWGTSDVYRYRPNRTDFNSLSSGVWTRVRTSQLGIVPTPPAWPRTCGDTSGRRPTTGVFCGFPRVCRTATFRPTP